MWYIDITVDGQWLEYSRYERYYEMYNVVRAFSCDTPYRVRGPIWSAA
jgi:hypothetical protein